MITETLGWIVSVVSVLGGIAAVLRWKINFILYLITDIAWIGWSILTKTYSQIPMWIAFAVLCVLGFFNWRRLEKRK